MFWRRSEPKQIYSEKELEDRANNDNYVLTRALKFAFCMSLLLVITVITCGGLWQYISNPGTRETVNDLLLQNIAGIIFFALALLGIKVSKS